VNCTLARMKRPPLHRRTNPARTVSAVVLFTLITLVTLFLVSTAGLCQGSSVSPEAVPATRSANSGTSSVSQIAQKQSAPDAARFHYLRLIAVLCSGLVISAARLARKFRLFWGLGVFANPYAVLFLIFGVGVCGVPVTSEGTLKAVPFLGNLGPWIADLSGIVVALVLPAIRFKAQTRPAGENQVRDLEGGSSTNPIVAVIEDAIKECILRRMHQEVVMACRRYDWDTIKLAAGRALEQEMTIRPMPDEKYDAVRLSIENFQANPDARQDSRDKYNALTGLLRWCSFKRLLNGLNAAARETEA
jgi:hypothetical protein